MITTSDLQGLIAFAITNNKSAVIRAMNATGNVVASSITDDDLMQQVWNIFTARGLDALKRVLSLVPIDRSKVTQDQAKTLAVKFGGADPNAKLTDWLNTAWQNIGDLVGGHSTTNVVPTIVNTIQQSPINSGVIIAVSIIAIIAILILAFKS